jgi:hypothetical protein
MVPFSEHEGGFFPTGGVASFPDCSEPTFYGTLEHASRMGGFSARQAAEGQTGQAPTTMERKTLFHGKINFLAVLALHQQHLQFE